MARIRAEIKASTSSSIPFKRKPLRSLDSMTPSRKTLAPCMACCPGAATVITTASVTADDTKSSSLQPCCDESCLENIARRECISQCGGSDTSICSSDDRESRTAVPIDLGSPVGLTQSRKRKREACGTHLRSVNARYLSILSRLGCVCKELIARNLEPCCRRGDLALAKKSSASPIAGKALQKNSCIGQECCGVDDSVSEDLNSNECRSTDSGEFCGTDIKCCDTSKQDKCKAENTSDRNIVVNRSGRIVNGKTDCCTTVSGIGCTEARANTCDVSNEKLDCCIANKGTSASKHSGPEHDAEKNSCTDQKSEDACGSTKARGSRTKDDHYSNCDSYEVTVCSGKPCCDTDEHGISNTTASGAITCSPTYSRLVKDTRSDCSASPCQPSISEAQISTKLHRDTADHRDIEKGAKNPEHVVLDVHGLTCVGCEMKLLKSLQVIPGVYNLRTSLVLSQAEFDFDQQAGSVVQVIKSVEIATGFTCQQLSNKGYEVDVIVDGDVKAFIARKYPEGVIQMIASDKQTVKLTYNPKVIGARTLLEIRFDSPLKLAVHRGSSEIENGRKHVRNTAWITMFSAILTIPVLVLAWAPLPPREIAYGGTSLGLATLVQFAIAGPFYPSALKAMIFTRIIEMDLLIVLSTSAAYIFSVISFVYQVIGQPLPTGEFFETSTLLVTLIMLGRLVSAFARQRSVQSVSVRSLQAEVALICDADGRGDKLIDARLLQYGDFFKITPDSRVPTDGVVVRGTTEIDESMMTGESLPVEKSPGAFVRAGSLNRTGVIIIRLTHLPGDNTISMIATMVDEAKFSKPKIQAAVDIAASYLVPVILVLTVITFIIWILVGIFVRHQNGSRAVVNAVTYAISVLIVSCPCAIGLAVPMVVVIAGGVAAKHGVIFRSAMAIETARKTSHVVFDKTGTLTQGKMSVTAEVCLSGEMDFAASVTLGLTSDSKHPVSAAVSAYLKERRVIPAKISDSRSVVSKGIEGTLNGLRVRCGNTRWLSAENHPELQGLLSQGLTVFCVSVDGRVLAAFGLSDPLRPESCAVVTELLKRGITVSIISGDETKAVEDVGVKLGVDTRNLRSRCSPGDKEEFIKNLMSDEKEMVMFCGDGTNDAVAIARAHIGVHINSGSDIAQTAADVVLTRPCLNGILVLVDISRAAFRRIFVNFAWSFVYNLFAISLASGAFVHVRISPQYAGLGEIVSVLPVILIALQLKSFKREY